MVPRLFKWLILLLLLNLEQLLVVFEDLLITLVLLEFLDAVFFRLGLLLVLLFIDGLFRLLGDFLVLQVLNFSLRFIEIFLLLEHLLILGIVLVGFKLLVLLTWDLLGLGLHLGIKLLILGF